MFGVFDTSLTGLDRDTQLKLAMMLSSRAEYMRLAADMNDRKAKLLADPTEEGEQELAEFSSVVVAPARMRVAEQMSELLKESIDVDKLQGMLPMLLAGAMSAVNLPLVLNILGLDPDMISQVAKLGKDFLQHDD